MNESFRHAIGGTSSDGGCVSVVKLFSFRQSVWEALHQAVVLGASSFVTVVFIYWTIAFWWLYLPGLVLVPVVTVLATRRRPIDYPPAFFACLPFFAYVIGVLSNCLAFTVMGADSFWWTLSLKAPSGEKLYGVYGIPAAVYFVLCVLRYCIVWIILRSTQRLDG